MKPSFYSVARALFFIFLMTASALDWCEPLPFRRAMELVQQRGTASVAAADQARARAGYVETKSVFLPQLVLGSGIAKTYGFPLSIEGSAPSVVSVNYQSTLYSPAARDFLKAAEQEWLATTFTTKDQSQATLLEAAITYIQLDTATSRVKVLAGQQTDADKLVTIVSERVQGGVDTQLELTRSKLAAAQVRMRLADVQGQADVLRERLGQLTGLPAASIDTVTESIPKVPDVSQQAGIENVVLDNSPAVKASQQEADAKRLRAKAEHKAMWPSVDLVGQYGLFSRYNNYDLYFNRFQKNNATLGMAIRFPFLNFPQRARAEQADAEAVKAERQSTAARQQVSTDTIKLARAIRQLSAAEQVAQLDYELAQAQAAAIEARIQSGAPGMPGPQGQPGTPPPGPRDLQGARLTSSEKYAVYLDTEFELQKARLQLLRATGKLDEWALGGK